MSKIELPSIANPSNVSLMNDNFKKIEDVLNEEVLYRKGYTGEPNEMQSNLDMNSKRILNLLDAVDLSEPVTLRQLIEVDSGEALQLRADLAAPSGSSLVGFIQDGVGAVPRTSLDKMRERVSAPDFGAVGDGVANDTAVFSVIEALSYPDYVDGLGKTYVVNAIPTGKKYINGIWKVGSTLTPFEHVGQIRAGNNVIAIGQNAAPGSISDDFIAIGRDAGAAAIEARNCIAIGKGAMLSNRYARHNIAIGLESLRSIVGVPSTSLFEGTRNIGIGGNAGRFMTIGNRNILLGRDVAHGLVDGTNNIVQGNGAMMGDGPNSLDPGVIINQTPLHGNRNIVIGTEAGKYVNANDMVWVGYQAGLNAKDVTGMVGIGYGAFLNFQSDMSYWGTTQTSVSVNCTYSQAGTTTIAINSVAHGLSSGFKILLRFLTGANGSTTFNDDIWFDVTVIDVDNFTIQSPVSATASGTASYSKVATTTPYTTLRGETVGVGRDVGSGVSNYRAVGIGDRVGAQGLGIENTGIGYAVFNTAAPGAGNTAIGAYSQQKVTSSASGNVSIGVLTLNNLTTGGGNAVGGGQAGRNMTTGSNNTGFGTNAIRGITTATTNSGFGADALRFDQTGLDHNFNNCGGFGFDSRVSGNNQIQLGNSATTTYVYGTVQNRSDARDKADIRDTELGIEFIMGLRPIDGRWDMRDDYLVPSEDGESLVSLPRDGSKKRERFHHWFVAQEVKELCDRLGVNFGGFQDHSINGGNDVQTLGYDEFIPPAVKAIQQCWERIDGLESRIALLESKNG